MLQNRCPKQLAEFKDCRLRLFSSLEQWHSVHPSFWHLLCLPHDMPANEPDIDTRRLLVDPLTAFRLYERPVSKVEIKNGRVIGIWQQDDDDNGEELVPAWLFEE